ncbi:huntingtin-interacting protein 1-like isoform X2 [Artemia franciscana]|uniref:Huntingtin-interacting protein 1 n=1 Tax=Artemia franciscana TaxID=6661 RepID=A0AA88IBH7_ARTSF|nr:hypothetical protein QYM36_002455 [Artemia franciscana]
MSSYSSRMLPKQRKSTTILDHERESFEKSQISSISKAINNVEVPAKEKHIRNIIIGTFQEKCGRTFWTNVNQIQLKSHPIAAWKFCHILHKILRDGHPDFIRDSMPYIPMITDLGKLWGHLKEGYGRLIKSYCELLVGKLEFHRRNPPVPGNLSLTEEEICSITENDINNYFQLAVEMLDYMDDILKLAMDVFASLDMSRATSMTNSGQCRLAPMIPCIQDSSPLYDYTVKLLFRLHGALPLDTLAGHRERFNSQFGKLKKFYVNSSNLQYFKNLVQVPTLPEKPPNFLVASELSRHVTPVVVVPDPPQESVLVDFDSSVSEASFDVERSPQRNGAESPELLAERDRYIEQLLYQIEQLTEELQRVKSDYRRYLEEYLERIHELESVVSDRDRELNREREAKVDMIRQLEDGTKIAEAETIQRIQNAEGKAKNLEDKFIKLKDVYQKLREEHISLLRQKADVEKHCALQKAQLTEKENLKEEVKAKKAELENLAKTLEEVMGELESRKSDIATLEVEKKNMEETIKVLEEKMHDIVTNSSQLQTNITQIEAEKSEVSALVSEMKTKNQDLLKRIDSLEEDLKVKDKDTSSLLSFKDDLLKDKNEIDKQLSEERGKSLEMTKKIESLEQELKEKVTEASTFLTNNERLHVEVAELKVCMENLEARKNDLEGELMDSINCLHSTDKLRTDLEREVEKLTVNTKALLEQKTKLAEELDISRSEFDEVRNMMRSLQSSLYEKLEERKQLIDTRERLECELTHSKEELLKERSLRSEVEKRVVTLTGDLQELQVGKDAIFEEKSSLSTALEEEKRLKALTIQQMEEEKEEQMKRNENLEKNNVELLKKLYDNIVEEAKSELSSCVETLSEPPVAIIALSPDISVTRAVSSLNSLENIVRLLENLREVFNGSSVSDSVVSIMQFTDIVATFVIDGKVLATSFPDMDKGESLLKSLQAIGVPLLAFINSLKNGYITSKKEEINSKRDKLREAFLQADKNIEGLSEILRGKSDGENAEKLLEDELSGMEKAIDDAAARFEEMLKKSRGADSGIKLEVSEKVLDSCTSLMQSVRQLIRKSRGLQEEIVLKGKGSATSKDFYKRNSQWADGLISASKTVGFGASLLVDAADKVVSGQTKFEQLVVSAQEIAASTAQLVFAGRVKADPNSNKLYEVARASKDVSEATGGVVATAKLCSQLVEENAQMDFSKLTLHQAKKLEMESQIRVKELENSLEQERVRLSTLRKQHYQMAGEAAGWEQVS